MSNNIGELTDPYYTRTFSKDGWQGLFTFDPEAMTSMGAHLYSFKNGQMYKHSAGSDRNTFYGVESPSKIIGVINQSPFENKVFKTFMTDSTTTWKASFETDQKMGEIEAEWFDLKEGDYFAHIRNLSDDVDPDLRSARGIGEAESVTASGGALTITFPFTIDIRPMVGDKAYRSSGGGPSLIGTIASVSPSAIVISAPYTAPAPGQLIMVIKDSTAESYGLLGYYMRYELELNSNAPSEIFHVETDVLRSYP
jgi:hypothetical protein